MPNFPQYSQKSAKLCGKKKVIKLSMDHKLDKQKYKSLLLLKKKKKFGIFSFFHFTIILQKL